VLSQRTVGKLQRFLELMFSSRLAYGMPPALSPAEFHRRLYEADVRPELLDYIVDEYSYNPSLLVRSLHEGQPIDFVNRTIDWNLTLSESATREIGDTYLLVFAAVALRRFEELANVQRDFIVEAALDFTASLRDDGFQYSDGIILNHSGVPVVPVPLGVPLEQGHTPPPQKRTEPQTRGASPTPRSDVRRVQTMPQKEQKDKPVAVALIGAAAVVIAALIGYFGVVRPNKPDPVFIDYTVRVKDAKSLKPIVSAKVNLAEDQKAPQPYYTDSDGVVYINNLSKDTKTISVEVTALGYQSQARNGLTAHTGSQDFLLEALPPPPIENTNMGSAGTNLQPTKTEPVSNGTAVHPAGSASSSHPQVSSPSVVKLQPDEKTILAAAQKDWRLQKYDEAEAQFKKASELNPEDSLPSTCVAMLDAVKEAQRQVRQNRDDGEAHFALAKALDGAGLSDTNGECDKATKLEENVNNGKSRVMSDWCYKRDLDGSKRVVQGRNSNQCAGSE
jgi:hypothetical protein